MIQRGMKPSKLYLPHDKSFMGGRLIDYLAAHFSHISLEPGNDGLTAV